MTIPGQVNFSLVPGHSINGGGGPDVGSFNANVTLASRADGNGRSARFGESQHSAHAQLDGRMPTTCGDRRHFLRQLRTGTNITTTRHSSAA